MSGVVMAVVVLFCLVVGWVGLVGGCVWDTIVFEV